MVGFLFGVKCLTYGYICKHDKWLGPERQAWVRENEPVFLQKVGGQSMPGPGQHQSFPLLTLPQGPARNSVAPSGPAVWLSGPLQCPSRACQLSQQDTSGEVPWRWWGEPKPRSTPNHKGKIRMEIQRLIFVLNFHWLKKYVNGKDVDTIKPLWSIVQLFLW